MLSDKLGRLIRGIVRVARLSSLAFYRRSPEGGYLRRSLQLPRFERGKLSAVTTFVGPTYLKSFQIPERVPETERFRAPRLS